MPIIHSGNNPIFADIEENNFNINSMKIENKITDKTIAIQLIHFAGYPCEIDKIIDVAKKKDLLIIEDCAQSFGAKYKGKNIGSFGDISCFSLAKNLYGIVGGILATNNKGIYERAIQIQNTFEKTQSSFLYYRFLRNYFRSKPDNRLYNFLHKKLIELKNKSRTENNDSSSALINYLKYPDKKIFNLSWSQIQKFEKLHEKRKQQANIYIDKVNVSGNLKTPQNNSDIERSFVKFYVTGNFNSKKDIEKLNRNGIEAKHLEEDYGVYYQTRFDNDALFKDNSSLKNCNTYFRLHDSLISLPLTEDLQENKIDIILNALKELTNQ